MDFKLATFFFTEWGMTNVGMYDHLQRSYTCQKTRMNGENQFTEIEHYIFTSIVFCNKGVSGKLCLYMLFAWLFMSTAATTS